MRTLVSLKDQRSSELTNARLAFGILKWHNDHYILALHNNHYTFICNFVLLPVLHCLCSTKKCPFVKKNILSMYMFLLVLLYNSVGQVRSYSETYSYGKSDNVTTSLEVRYSYFNCNCARQEPSMSTTRLAHRQPFTTMAYMFHNSALAPGLTAHLTSKSV